MPALAAKPEFPVLRMMAWLTAAIAAAAALNAMLLPGVFGGRPGIAKGAILTASVVYLSGIACIIPLVKARDSAQLANGFFIGMILRCALGIGVVFLAIDGFGLPDVPVVASLMLAYLPALFIETRFIIRHIPVLDAWRKANGADHPEKLA